MSRKQRMPERSPEMAAAAGCSAPRLLAIVLSCLLLSARQSVACKYSVRDIGFARLQVPQETLLLALDQQAWPEVRAEWFAPELRAAEVATAVLDLADASARQRWQQARPAVPAEGRESAEEAAAWLLLESPAFPALRLPLSQGDLQDRLRFDAATLRLLQTPVRERIKGLLLEHHSLLLIVSGTDSDANQHARKLADATVQAIGQSMSSLPKPIARPPVVEVLSVEQQPHEAAWLWSLGADPQPGVSARIVVLYGRFRRMGEVVEVPGITQSELQAIVSLVGQDCECDLGRNWVDEPTGWHAWTPEDDQRAYDQLGFDPGNPLVMAEMTRILARGPSAPAPTRGAIRSDPLMGFEVISLEDAQTAGPSASSGETAQRSGGGPGPVVGPLREGAMAAVTPQADRPLVRAEEADWPAESARSATPLQQNASPAPAWVAPALLAAGSLAAALLLATAAIIWSARRSRT